MQNVLHFPTPLVVLLSTASVRTPEVQLFTPISSVVPVMLLRAVRSEFVKMDNGIVDLRLVEVVLCVSVYLTVRYIYVHNYVYVYVCVSSVRILCA